MTNKSDFSKASTLEVVKGQLNDLTKKLKTKKEIRKETLKEIKANCATFFMEVIACLCFGRSKVPETALVEVLMKTIFERDESKTQDITPFDDGKMDKKPTIRSFLMKLLMDCRYT